MATQKTLTRILDLAAVSQYLSFNDQANKLFLKGGNLTSRLPTMIACERLVNKWTFDTDPENPSLRGTMNYLYDLLGPYALQAEIILNNLTEDPPVVSGPADQTANEGDEVTFTVTVTSDLAYTIQWYKNGVVIPGETELSYTFTAEESDTGSTYNAVATNAAGSASGRVATLTVDNPLIGYAYYGATNYFAELNAGTDDVPYQIEFPIDNAQPLEVTMPIGAANNMNMVFKYPASQGIKTAWFNTVLNSGVIPDQAMRDIITIGDWNYIVSRDEISIDTTESPNMTFS